MTTSALFEVEVCQSTLVIIPQDNVSSLDDDRVQPELLRLYKLLEAPELRNVIVDFGQVNYFGSSMLEALLKLWKQIGSRGGKMAVCNVSPIGHDVLEVGRFITLWDVYKSRDEALLAIEH